MAGTIFDKVSLFLHAGGSITSTDITDSTAIGREILTDADAAAVRTSIGVGTGTGDALTSSPLSQFASTTSAELRTVMSDETGTGALVFAGGALGAATATSVNKVTITAPASTATLTIANNATLTCSASATVSGTNTGDVANTAVTTGKLSQFASTSSSELAGVMSDETGSGALVFATSPTLVTPVLGVASATSLALGNGNVTAVKQVTFNSVPTANKSGSAPALVDWTTGSFQEIVLTGNVTGTPTFTAPTGPSRLTLRVKQGGAGSFTIAAWPSGVRWPGGTAPTLSTAVGAVDYVTFLYDGTNYDGMGPNQTANAAWS